MEYGKRVRLLTTTASVEMPWAIAYDCALF